MGSGFNKRLQQQLQAQQGKAQSARKLRHGELLAAMVDGREYESLVKFATKGVEVDLGSEMQLAVQDVEAVRGRPLVLYAANVTNRAITGDTSINYSDDLLFSETLAHVPKGDSVDIMIVTGGGLAQQVHQFVTQTRLRFKHVAFIIPYMALSAGTIWALSGNAILMGRQGFLGPIDPQVPGKDGRYVPAQALLTLIKEIQKRGDDSIGAGRNPDWTDQLILRNIDPKEIGNAISQSRYSIQLAAEYLRQYKFDSWATHSSNGAQVTPAEKEAKSKQIAEALCSHDLWKTHSHGISRETLFQEIKLKVDHIESIDGLDRAIRRLWALLYWCFEHTNTLKTMVSSNYAMIRSEGQR